MSDIGHTESVHGEGFGIDMGRPFARHVNGIFGHSRKTGESTVINLGEGIGEVPINDVRFRESEEPGSLLAYMRQESTKHKVVVAVVAIGVVAAGLYMLQHNKRDKPGPEV